MEELIQQLDPHSGGRAFLQIMGAVLAANVFTFWFVWAAWNYSRLERDGNEKRPGSGSGLYLGVISFVLLMVAAAFVANLG